MVDQSVAAREGGLPPRAHALDVALRAAFEPVHLEVVDESYMHSTGKGAESHFKVVVVSAIFGGKSPVARHKSVYAACSAVLAGGLHALAVTARTPEEWQLAPSSLKSPACLGG